jgi:hypothetical protein
MPTTWGRTVCTLTSAVSVAIRGNTPIHGRLFSTPVAGASRKSTRWQSIVPNSPVASANDYWTQTSVNIWRGRTPESDWIWYIAIQQFIDSLPPSLQKVAVLYNQGYEYAEIASARC